MKRIALSVVTVVLGLGTAAPSASAASPDVYKVGRIGHAQPMNYKADCSLPIRVLRLLRAHGTYRVSLTPICPVVEIHG